MEDKVYIGIGKAIPTKYGELMKLSFPMDDIEKLVEIARDNNGWANLVLKERREPSEKGATHYMVVDTWKPEQKMVAAGQTDDDDLPF